jgi:hypothetical protein
MFDLDQAMTRADQWEAEDSENPVTTTRMLAVDALGTMTMRRHWRPLAKLLAKLLAACERRATATCRSAIVMGPYHFIDTGCHDGRHIAGCAVLKADADIAAALAAVHATGRPAKNDRGTKATSVPENPGGHNADRP